MLLECIWFFLWALLWAMYFATDGFDLGVGMLLPVLGKDEDSRRLMVNSTGPVWNGNEVWLIAAGGATFAAFPRTYAVLFSSFYTALMLLLAALIIRGVSLEYRHKAESAGGRKACDIGLFAGSFSIALLIGVAFGNIFRGLAIVGGVNQGGFLDLLNPYAICTGLFFIAMFLLHGAAWLLIKTQGAFEEKTLKLTRILWFIVLILTIAFLTFTFSSTHLFDNYLKNPFLFLLPLLAVAVLLGCRFFLHKKNYWKAWACSGAFIFTCTFFAVVGLYPNMLPSTIDPAVNSIIYHQAASSKLTLTIMLGVVLLFIPLAIVYQVWAYRLFKHKVDTENLIY